ncbi:hypothetical protein BDZ91DRAFT_822562 [Kalaharituber pfeilii]|nr:hypothetical protein BDZ91DRAFT_822562 [Kalaharituber pfeilii]
MGNLIVPHPEDTTPGHYSTLGTVIFGGASSPATPLYPPSYPPIIPAVLSTSVAPAAPEIPLCPAENGVGGGQNPSQPRWPRKRVLNIHPIHIYPLPTIQPIHSIHPPLSPPLPPVHGQSVQEAMLAPQRGHGEAICEGRMADIINMDSPMTPNAGTAGYRIFDCPDEQEREWKLVKIKQHERVLKQGYRFEHVGPDHLTDPAFQMERPRKNHPPVDLLATHVLYAGLMPWGDLPPVREREQWAWGKISLIDAFRRRCEVTGIKIEREGKIQKKIRGVTNHQSTYFSLCKKAALSTVYANITNVDENGGWGGGVMFESYSLGVEAGGVQVVYERIERIKEWVVLIIVCNGIREVTDMPLREDYSKAGTGYDIENRHHNKIQRHRSCEGHAREVIRLEVNIGLKTQFFHHCGELGIAVEQTSEQDGHSQSEKEGVVQAFRKFVSLLAYFSAYE